jgi:thiol-disulfide isomerase/thioredoxin
MPRVDLALLSAAIVACFGYWYYPQLSSSQANKESQNNKMSAVHPSIVALMPSVEFSRPKPIAGLLFAASWCPDCTDVVPAIGQVAASSSGQQLLDVIYVASDHDEPALLQFKPSSLRHVPFAAEPERSELKRKFRTCAAKEMSSLGLSERKNGIPTLILLDSSTGGVLTENAVDDVMSGMPIEDVLGKWKSLMTSMQSIQ